MFFFTPKSLTGLVPVLTLTRRDQPPIGANSKLRKMMEHSTLNPPGGAPANATDYFTRAHEFATPITTDPKTGVKSFRAPSTLGSQLLKCGGSLLAGSTFIPLIGGFGSDVIGGWMGYDDMQGEWCAADAQAHQDGLGWFTMGLGLLSGRDCTMWKLDSGYIANGDQGVTFLGTVAGYTYLGIVPTSNWPGKYLPCYSYDPDMGHGWGPGFSMNFGYYGYGGTSIGLGAYELATWGGSVVTAALNSCRNAFGLENVATWIQPLQLGEGWLELLNAQNEVVEKMTEGHNDPERYMDCVVTLDNGQTLVTSSVKYRESDGEVAPPACPSTPAGNYATNIDIVEKQVGTNGGPGGGPTETVVYSEATTPAYQEWAQTYPECGDGACLLDVRIKSGTKLAESCFKAPAACEDWWSDPNKNDKYQCTYGAHNVDIDECAVYAGIFKNERVAVGAPYSDPMTGEWDGLQNAPRLDGQAMSQGIQNPAGSRSCTGMNITGFDPVGFVMRPIQCALEWAFVPRPLVVETELMASEDSWEGKPPAVIAAAVANAAPTAAVEGCSRSVSIFSGDFQTSITPLDACPGSWSAPLATISKIATAGIMAVLVFVVVRRQISGMVGYNQGQ